ncbi:MAG: hypothetical protein NVSMB9_05700 [Isosphaeraceae bacterium]
MPTFRRHKESLNSKPSRTVLSSRARRSRRVDFLERLEDRCLLAITSTTPVAITLNEGSSFNGPVMNFTSNDPGPQNAANYTASIVWGDLTTSPGTITALAGGGFAVNGTHTYAEDGSYTVSVTINDLVDATTVARTTSATVNELSLTASGTPFTATEGQAFSGVVGNFSDPGSPDPASAFTATINWGDGTPVVTGTVGGAAGAYTVSGTHTYADEGVYTAIVTFFETNTPAFTISTNSTGTVNEGDVLSGGAIAIAPGSVVEGQNFNGRVATFNNTGFPSNSTSDFSAVITWGDGTTSPGTVVAGGAVGSFAVNGTHTFLEEGTFPVSVTVSDNAPGTASITIAGPVVVADAPLTATAVPVNGTEGAPLTNIDVATFTDADSLGTATDFLATIDWGDGTSTAGRILQDAAGTFHVQGSHTYLQERSTPYPVVVTIVDNGDGRTVGDPTNSRATANGSATIKQSPLLPVANAVVATEGTAVPAGTPLASFTDTGGGDAVGDYSATINWGDGTPTVPATVSLLGNGGNYQVTSSTPHTYVEEGIFPVTVTITDNDPTNPGRIPTSAQTTTTANVAGAPVVPVAGANITTTEGKLLSGVALATFTDTNPLATAGDFTATIDWGDGSANSVGTITKTGSTFTVTGDHVYNEERTTPYRITVLVDDGTKKGSTSLTATVADAPLLGASGIPVTAVEAQSQVGFAVATFTDANPLATPADFITTINWGDGSPTVTGNGTVLLVGGGASGTTFRVVGTHTFAEEGTFPISVTITDLGGSSVAINAAAGNGASATVTDAPLSAQGTTVTGIEGLSTGPMLVATFTDADPKAVAGDFTATIDWGDGAPSVGTVTSAGSANGTLFRVTGSHTYSEEGTYSLSVTIIDTAGKSQTLAAGQAIIRDANLVSATPQPTVSPTEGIPFTGPVASFNDVNPGAPLSDFTATIDWGDGTPASAGVLTQPGGTGTPFLVTGTHTYADALVNGGTGPFRITVNVIDQGDSTISLINTANVKDVAITVTGQLNPSSDSGVSSSDGITNVNQPNFFGTSEPLSTVQLYVQAGGGTGVRTLVGQGTTDSSGRWSITTNRLADGTYTVSATATDAAGHTKGTGVIQTAANGGPLVIDTVGPKVVDVLFGRLSGQILVTFQDERGGLDTASLIDGQNYTVTKIHANRPGTYLVSSLQLTPGGGPTDPRGVLVTINNGKPLRGGHYTFTIHSGGVRDLAGNALDGEFYGFFPSGNNIPGGDFVARLDALHRRVFGPRSNIGPATPVSPPGRLPETVFVGNGPIPGSHRQRFRTGGQYQLAGAAVRNRVSGPRSYIGPATLVSPPGRHPATIFLGNGTSPGSRGLRVRTGGQYHLAGAAVQRPHHLNVHDVALTQVHVPRRKTF